MYKGRKKKTIEYFAIKSVDKSQKNKLLQEVSYSLYFIFPEPICVFLSGNFDSNLCKLVDLRQI